MDTNIIIVGGRLTADAEGKDTNPTANGNVGTWYRFTIANNKPMTKEQQEKAKANNKPTADFIQCNITSYSDGQKNYFNTVLKKGQYVVVTGRLRDNNYTDKDGKTQYGKIIDVDDINVISTGGTNEGGNAVQQTAPPQQATQQTPPPAPQPQPEAPAQPEGNTGFVSNVPWK